MDYLISAESPMDLDYNYVSSLGIKFIKYTYVIEDTEFYDDMGEDKEALSDFYKEIENGKFPKTKEISVSQYENYFRGLLEENNGVLHICLGSAMTESVKNAFEARDNIKDEYPDKTLVVVDSCSASSGYGLMVELAKDKRKEGKNIFEVEEYLNSISHKINHILFTTDLKYFRKSGRVKDSTITVAKLFRLCPMMNLDYEGSIRLYGKERGVKKAIARTINDMKECAENGEDYAGKCFISHSGVLDIAKDMKDQILINFQFIGDVKIFNIGSVIGSHTGIGTIAVYFIGNEREKK